MKMILFTMLFVLSLTTTVNANEENYILHLQKELHEDGSAASIAVSNGDVIYGGLSLNQIKSSKNIQFDNRNTIYPVYLFFGLRAPWTISPYIEFGGDLGEIIIDNIFKNEDDNDEPNVIDYYYSAGINFNINDKFLVSLYAKKYNFIFNDFIDGSTTIQKLYTSRPVSYGIGIGMQF